MPWICSKHFIWPIFSTPSFLNHHLWFVLIPDFIFLLYGKMTEFPWGHLGHTEVKTNTFKKHAISWFPSHLEDKWHWKQCMRCYCTKIRVSWDEVFWTFSLFQHSHSSEQASPWSGRERQFQPRGFLLNSWSWRETGIPRLIPDLGLTPFCMGRKEEPFSSLAEMKRVVYVN